MHRNMNIGPTNGTRNWMECEDGSISALHITTLIGFMGLAGLAIDTSNAHLMQNRIDMAAEVAALAGAQDLPDVNAAQAAAMSYLEANLDPSAWGAASGYASFDFGEWDDDARTLDLSSANPDAISVAVNLGGPIEPYLLSLLGFSGFTVKSSSLAVGSGAPVCTPPVNLGNLTDYLFVYTDANSDANWQAATKGYYGDVAVDGLQANERTSGTTHFSGTIYTNDSTLNAWQDIVDDNPGAASVVFGQTDRITGLESDLAAAIAEIGALPVTAGYAGITPVDNNNLNFQNGTSETIVIDVSAGMKIDFQWNFFGDAGDLIVIRWDDDPAAAGYNGEVKMQSGGGIVPKGDLTPANFVHVAGNLNSSGGGTTPVELEPYLAITHELVSGGGFFTGYWLTTGDPDKNFENSPHSNGIWVGGWYTSNTKFSITGGTSGVHVDASLGPLGCAGASGFTSARLRH